MADYQHLVTISFMASRPLEEDEVLEAIGDGLMLQHGQAYDENSLQVIEYQAPESVA